MLAIRNDLGLLSEEYDPVDRRLLGNFPQAFSHVGLVNTAYNLEINSTSDPSSTTSPGSHIKPLSNPSVGGTVSRISCGRAWICYNFVACTPARSAIQWHAHFILSVAHTFGLLEAGLPAGIRLFTLLSLSVTFCRASLQRKNRSVRACPPAKPSSGHRPARRNAPTAFRKLSPSVPMAVTPRSSTMVTAPSNQASNNPSPSSICRRIRSLIFPTTVSPRMRTRVILSASLLIPMAHAFMPPWVQSPIPLGEHPGNTGNGIAVYRFEQGKLTLDRFLKIALQSVPPGIHVGRDFGKLPAGRAVPYPAGLAVLSGATQRPNPGRPTIFPTTWCCLIRNPERSSRTLRSTHRRFVPSTFPYTVVATRDGRRAWCSLWNASQVAELDLERHRVVRRIPLLAPKSPVAPGLAPHGHAVVARRENPIRRLSQRRFRCRHQHAAQEQFRRSFPPVCPNRNFPATKQMRSRNPKMEHVSSPRAPRPIRSQYSIPRNCQMATRSSHSHHRARFHSHRVVHTSRCSRRR